MKSGKISMVIHAILAVSVILLFVLFNKSQNSLVYVDSQKLVAGYEGMTLARTEFEGKTAAWKANLDTLRVEVEQEIKRYEASRSKLTPREKELSEALIQTKQEQYFNYQKVIQDKIQQEDQELTKKVLDKVNDYLKRYGKEHGHQIILAATQYGNIVYANDGIDITKEVIQGLNEEFQKP